MLRRLPLFIILLLSICRVTSPTLLQAQSLNITGTVYSIDGDAEAPLGGANLQLLSLPDSTFSGGTASAQNGAFRISDISPGPYLLIISHLGFATQTDEIDLADGNIHDLDIYLKAGSLQLEEFTVSARRPRVDVRGDTTAYHADGYQTNRDANVQDLVTRMPGFIMEDGQLQAQGENVVSVLLDGEEFFGEDAALVLKNLPAEIVEQIEVFDRESEQARFTGFRDGNTDRTVNIVTREGMNRGQFGRANSGYGSQTRYIAGGNYNHFNGSQRFSLIGMTNNLNQQNFSNEDLMGISEASGGGGRGGRRGNAARNFSTGSQSGISSVNSTGINYNDRWNETWRINASYFFNHADNVHDLFRERLYLTGFSADQRYDEDARNTSGNYNHRFDMRLEHDFDERRSIIFRPRIRYQKNRSFQTVDGFTLGQNNSLLNEVIRENQNNQSFYNIDSSLLYRHRFETRGRTISANLRAHISDRTGLRSQFDESVFMDGSENRIVNDQQTEIFTNGNTFSGNVSYTEPVSDRTQLLVSYQPSVNNNESVQDVFRFDETTNTYSLIDTTLTNRYDNRILSNRIRGSYRFRGERIDTNISLAWQHTGLTGEQIFPEAAGIRQTWQNFLPDASVQYNFGRRSNLRFSYDTSTRTPSVRQLQDVIDNSDPLRFTTGNPDLEQQYDHRLSLRLRHANPEAGSSTSAFLSLTITDKTIGNRTMVAEEDILLDGDIVLGRGSRLVLPDNIGSSVNFNTSVNRSIPVDYLSSNLNVNGGVGLNRRPSFIDDTRNVTDTYRLRSRFLVSSNISERVDFRFGYNANYSIVENSIRPELNNNYYAGRATGSFNLMPFGGLVLASDLNLRHYEGLGDDFNRSAVFWNGSVGYKFLENEAAEVRMTVFDILGQNDSIDRTIVEDYIEDYRSNVLTRYVIFSLSYNFRSFAGG